jgi:hypothetical protein
METWPDPLVSIVAIAAVYYTVKWIMIIINNKINGTRNGLF